MPNNPHHPAANRRLNELAAPVQADAASSVVDSNCGTDVAAIANTTDPYPTHPTDPTRTTAPAEHTSTPLVRYTNQFWLSRRPDRYSATIHVAIELDGRPFQIAGHELLGSDPAPHELACGLATDLRDTDAAVASPVWAACEALAHLEHLADSLGGIIGFAHAITALTGLDTWEHELRERWQRTLMRACVGAIVHTSFEALNRRPEHRTLHTRTHPNTQPRCSCGRWIPRTTVADLAGHALVGDLDTRITRLWWPDLARCAHTHEHTDSPARPVRRGDSQVHRNKPTRAMYMTACAFVIPRNQTDNPPAPLHHLPLWHADSDELGDHG